MKFLFLFAFINFYIMINAEPQINHFYIDDNEKRCALLDLSVDFSVDYPTKNGRNVVKLNMSKSSDNQNGQCSYGPTETDVQFNIGIPPTETLFLNFRNINNWVLLTYVEFNYTTPNINLPDAAINGTVTSISNRIIVLSPINNYFECKSKMKFELTDNVTLNLYYVKAKVFDVQNNSFGNDKTECPQDFYNSTTSISLPTTITTTETTVTSEKTTKPTTTSTRTTTRTTIEPTTSPKTESTSTSNSITSQTSKISTRSSAITTHTALPFSTTQPPTDDFTFFIRDSVTQIVCLIFKSRLEVKIKYQLKNNQENQTIFNIKSNAPYHGSCSPNKNNIIITWLPGFSVNFTFSKQNTYSILSNVSMNYVLAPNYFPNALYPNMVITSGVSYGNQFKMPIGNYYTCSNVTLQDGSSVSITLTSFQYEAFGTTKEPKFTGTETSCDSTIRNPLVAIVVGVVLAGFLIIVVIIFLVFRYKAHKRKDYEEI